MKMIVKMSVNISRQHIIMINHKQDIKYDWFTMYKSLTKVINIQQEL